MRLLLLALTLASAPAVACPLPAICVTLLPDTTHLPARLDLPARTPLVGEDPLAMRTAKAPPPRAAVEMPWIWQVLRTQVYDQLPTYTERTFTMTLEPMVVTGSFDTIPGVGLAGMF